MGVILWELYHGRLAGLRTDTGELRYQPDFPEFPATCPPAFRKLAHRCLQKQPHNRLHASQVVQRLQVSQAAGRGIRHAGGRPSRQAVLQPAAALEASPTQPAGLCACLHALGRPAGSACVLAGAGHLKAGGGAGV